MKINTRLEKEGTTRLPTRRNNWLSAAMIAIVCLTVPAANVLADATAFSRIIVFGDSLSDTGNFYARTGGYPPAPYYNGRFSNGKLWVEYLAEALQMQIQSGDNYAVAGATTGRLNVNNGVAGKTYPGLQDEIDAFQASGVTQGTGDALFVVWAGANDFFAGLAAGIPPQIIISNGVYNTALAVMRLYQSGAQNVLVANMPNLGLTPSARSSGAGAAITALCQAYNSVLGAMLDGLAAAGAPTIRVDSFQTLSEMAGVPSEFGFTNVTQAFLTTGGDPDEFLFWDQVHPTTVGHEVLAREAAISLIAYFSPRQGNGMPPALINALHGLVRAGGK